MPAEQVSAKSITGTQIQDLWTRHSARYTRSLGRIDDVREMLAGERQAPLPAALANLPDAEAFRVDRSDKYTSVLKLRNMLAEKIPHLKRQKTTTSDAGERNSSRIERFINPTIEDNLSAQDLADLLLCEAEAAIIVVPNRASYKKLPSTMYGKDSKDILPAYQRDKDGRSVDDYEDDDEKKTFRPSQKASRQAYEKHRRMKRARCLPAEIRLLSRKQCVPINPQIKGTDVVVDGLLVRTRFERSELIKRKWVWDGMSDHLEPKDESEGDTSTGEFWLYEAWLTDEVEEEDGTYSLRPYVAYSVAGKSSSNSRDGFDADAVIDLREQCGLKTLPVIYGYGWRWAATDADKRAMPYPWPFGRSWQSLDAFLTGKSYAGWAMGFLAWFLKMPTNMDASEQQAWLESVRQNPMIVEPFKVLPVMGDPIPAVYQGAGGDINEMIGALAGSLSQDLVNPLATGGGSAASALERSVVSADTVGGISDVQRSMLSMWRRTGEVMLEVLCGIARMENEPITYYGTPDTPSGGTGVSPTRSIIELKPDWLGAKGQESFDLEADFPRTLLDNLAQNQQFFGMWKDGGLTDEMWADLIGIDDPERFIAQLIYDQWKKSPAGVQVLMRDAAEFLGDKELVAMFTAQEQGAAGPNGEPLGMAAGVQPPMAPPGQGQGPMPVGVNVGNPAISQLAATVGAQIQNDGQGQLAQPVPMNVAPGG